MQFYLRRFEVFLIQNYSLNNFFLKNRRYWFSLLSKFRFMYKFNFSEMCFWQHSIWKVLTASSSSSTSWHSFDVQHSIVCCNMGGSTLPAAQVFAANLFLNFRSLVWTPFPQVTLQLDHTVHSLSSHMGSFCSLTGLGGQYLWTASQLALSVNFLWQMYLLSSLLYL